MFFNQNKNQIEENSDDSEESDESIEEDATDKSYYKPFILKLKGRNFKKIFNEKYIVAMHHTVELLMKEFHAQTVLFVNDEILLVFHSRKEELFNGNYLKMQTTIGSYASSVLSLKLEKVCSFSSTVINFDTEYEIIKYLNWRQKTLLSHSSNMNLGDYEQDSTTQDKMNRPVFIKRKSYTDLNSKKQYKYIKFILHKMKLNNYYLDLLCSPDMTEEHTKNTTNYYTDIL